MCRKVVAMVAGAGCEPNAVTLVSMLNCCVYARPRDHTQSAAWFMEHVGSKHLRLSPQLEKAAQKAFGARDAAKRLSWAKKRHPRVTQRRPKQRHQRH